MRMLGDDERDDRWSAGDGFLSMCAIDLDVSDGASSSGAHAREG